VNFETMPGPLKSTDKPASAPQNSVPIGFWSYSATFIAVACVASAWYNCRDKTNLEIIQNDVVIVRKQYQQCKKDLNGFGAKLSECRGDLIERQVQMKLHSQERQKWRVKLDQVHQQKISALEEKLEVTKELQAVQAELLKTLQLAAFVQSDTETEQKLNKNLKDEVELLTEENRILKSLIHESNAFDN